MKVGLWAGARHAVRVVANVKLDKVAMVLTRLEQ